jgi:hypothetical protein
MAALREAPRNIWGRLMTLDENIRGSLENWLSILELDKGNVIWWLVLLVVAVLSLPGCLFVVPLYRTFINPVPRSGVGVKRALIGAHIAILATILSPHLIIKQAEAKFGTDRLCEVCGRPGKPYWSVNNKDGHADGTFFCDQDVKGRGPFVDPKEIAGQAVASGADDTANAFIVLSIVIWGLGSFGAAVLSVAEDDLSVVLALSLLLLLAGQVLYSFQNWLHTIFGPSFLW